MIIVWELFPFMTFPRYSREASRPSTAKKESKKNDSLYIYPTKSERSEERVERTGFARRTPYERDNDERQGF